MHAVLAKLVNFLAWTTARESVDYIHVALAGKIAFLQIIENYADHFVYNELKIRIRFELIFYVQL